MSKSQSEFPSVQYNHCTEGSKEGGVTMDDKKKLNQNPDTERELNTEETEQGLRRYDAGSCCNHGNRGSYG